MVHFTNYQFQIYSLILLGTFIISTVEGIILWPRRHTRSALWLMLLEFAIAQWAFSIAFEAAAMGEPFKFLWSKIAYFGTATTSLLFFLFAFEYTHRRKVLSNRVIISLSIIPILTIFMAFTNDWHHWLWPGLVINPMNNIATYGHGFYFWVNVYYNYILIITGLFFLFRSLFQFPRFYRVHFSMLILASILPFSGNIIYVFNLNPVPGIDWTPVGFALTALILAWSVHRTPLFKLTPVARTLLIEYMTDGIIVAGAQNLIVDVNPATLHIFKTKSSSLIGQPISLILPATLVGEDLSRLTPHTPLEIELTHAETHTASWYEIRLIPLSDNDEFPTGKIILLRDISRRKLIEREREQLIQKLQEAMAQVKTLSGFIPICASCKKIRDDKGYWEQVEVYIRNHSEAEFTHGLCPECKKKLYPDFDEGDK